MNIQCISARPDHVDNIYGTGSWDFFQVKNVPDDIGAKMKRHIDVYLVPDDQNETAPKVTPVTASNEDPLQEFYDSLAQMSVEQMKDFVETKFNMKLDMLKFPTEQGLRDHTRMLVEQYGYL